MVIFGGFNKGGFFDDCHILKDLTWIRVNLRSLPSQPRGYHAACVLDDGRLVVTGGQADFCNSILDDAIIIDIQRTQIETTGAITI